MHLQQDYCFESSPRCAKVPTFLLGKLALLVSYTASHAAHITWLTTSQGIAWPASKHMTAASRPPRDGQRSWPQPAARGCAPQELRLRPLRLPLAVVYRIHHATKRAWRNGRARVRGISTTSRQPLFTHVLHTHYSMPPAIDFESGPALHRRGEVACVRS